jgi:protein FRG1
VVFAAYNRRILDLFLKPKYLTVATFFLILRFYLLTERLFCSVGFGAGLKMVKPLSFKGDKKQKKRKRVDDGAPPILDDAENDGRLVKAAEDDESDDSWVSADTVADVVGPIMFVLPSEPPSALACDANGKVFTLQVENIVDGNPSSAEPHDVRQVWVANKVAGTESFRFKGHHGKYGSLRLLPAKGTSGGADHRCVVCCRYLSCDKYGILSATSEAVSPLESFLVVPTPDTPGTFQIQSSRDTYLTVTASKSSKANAPAEVRGDGAEITFDTTLRIRLQARFKPRLKASKEEKAKEKISRKELEDAVGRRLEEDEVKRLKRARREGDYHEKLLDLKVKTRHDKYS